MLRVAAVAAAVIAVFMGAMYLRFSGETKRTPIVVATQDIPAGTLISPELIQTADTPVSDARSDSFADTTLVVGRVAKVPLASGEQITASKIGSVASRFADEVYSTDISPEGCGVPSGWGSGGIITDPIGQTLRQIRAANTCNQPEESTAKATRSTWDTAHAIVQARGASITKICEPRCSPDDHTKVWIVEVHGTFVPQQEPAYGGAMVPDSIQAENTPPTTPTAGTWFSIIPVLNY